MNNKNHNITITILKADGHKPTTMRSIIRVKDVYQITWSQFVKKLSNTLQISDKMHLNAMIPCGFDISKGDTRRVKENMTDVSCLMLDIDGSGATIGKFIGMNSSREFFLYTTSSHGIKSGDRFRVILPLEEAITPDELYAKREGFFKYFNSQIKVLDDRSTFDRSRIFFLPGVRTEKDKSNFRYIHNKGKLFDASVVPYPREKVSQTRRSFFEQDDDFVNYYDLTSFQQEEIDKKALKALLEASSLNKGDGSSFRLACKLCWLGIPDTMAVMLLKRFKKKGMTFDPKHKVKSAYKNGYKGVNRKYLLKLSK